MFGGPFWILFLATLAATGGYVSMLRQLKLQRDEARAVVHHLEVVPDPEPVRDDVRYDDETLWQPPVAVGSNLRVVPDGQWHPQAGVRVRRF